MGLGVHYLLCLVHSVTVATLKSCNIEHYPVLCCSSNCSEHWNGWVSLNFPVKSQSTLSFNKEVTLCDFDQSEVPNKFLKVYLIFILLFKYTCKTVQQLKIYIFMDRKLSNFGKLFCRVQTNLWMILSVLVGGQWE